MKALKLALIGTVAVLALTGCSSLGAATAGTAVKEVQLPSGGSVVCVIVGGSSGSNAVSCDWDNAK